MSDDSTFDDADLDWMKTLIPENAVPVGLFAVIQFFDENGEQKWKKYHPFDAPISSAIGVVMMGLLGMIADSDTGIEWQHD